MSALKGEAEVRAAKLTPSFTHTRNRPVGG